MELHPSKMANAILVPTMVSVQSTESTGIGKNEVQISAHKVTSKSFLREAQYVFPNIELKDLIVIHTMQHAQTEMVSFGEKVENEKDRLTLAFFDIAEQIRSEVTESGSYWSDYIDPCSGLPVCTDGQNIFSEVECAQTLLGYRVQNAGCCKIILHPQWGSSVYPASIFTTAPEEVVLEVIRKIGGGAGVPHK